MKILRTVVVFDAADLEEESAFWAAILNGQVARDDEWHTVFDESGEWRVGIDLNPKYVRPEWPNGVQQQQVHLNLQVEDQYVAHEEVLALGASLLEPGKSMDTPEGFLVYADPAGHPFCIAWGQPSAEQIASFLNNRAEGIGSEE
jgi:catechol 2,3-dioxygenase-like lactoylglutathione lyase family enzyme